MSAENFVEKFAMAIEVEPTELNLNTQYKTLDVWDSINALAVIAMTDTDFGVTISGQDVQNSHTIADLWEVVQSKKAVKA